MALTGCEQFRPRLYPGIPPEWYLGVVFPRTPGSIPVEATESLSPPGAGNPLPLLSAPNLVQVGKGGHQPLAPTYSFVQTLAPF